MAREWEKIDRGEVKKVGSDEVEKVQGVQCTYREGKEKG